jgi:hypothetical protein
MPTAGCTPAIRRASRTATSTSPGRIKDILVLSNGEKVPPGDMEMAIGLDPLFEQVLVVGEGRSVPDRAGWC